MRLQLAWWLSPLLLLVCARARAQPLASLDLRSGVYQDSDRTTVSTTAVAARGTIKQRLTIEARYLVDVVSSASVDVVTAATGTFRETRHETTAALDYHDGTRTARASYIYSVENDWESHTADAGFSHDLAEHNVTVGASGTFGYNAVGRAGDRNFHRTLIAGGASAFVSFTPTPRDLVSVNYTFGYLSGYQASPYRFVFFNDGVSRSAVPETDPETRARHALTIRYHHHLFKDSALQAHARGYADDWGVLSLTAGAEYLVGFGQFTVGAHVRVYTQGHAGFYRPFYDQPLRYMTADRELSTFVDGFGGLRGQWRRARWGPLAEVRAEVKVDGFGFWFFDFPRLQSRDGVVAELAIGASL
jgi:hypothetical protein